MENTHTWAIAKAIKCTGETVKLMSIKCRWSTVDVEWPINVQHPMACKVEGKMGGKIKVKDCFGG